MHSPERQPVHPRAGGEHWRETATNADGTGSSPRGRGTRFRASAGTAGERFIPARAGNTQSPIRFPQQQTVHPRAGGEHSSTSGVMFESCGSSPRGRGTPGRRRGRRHRCRFIPARAGNTIPSPGAFGAPPVHPRAGGEHHGAPALLHGSVGSSPRGRGTPWCAGIAPWQRRFIPARAGNTHRPTSESSGRSVHPRAGGEHERKMVGASDCIGSSPRGRGTPLRGRGRRSRQRFIPARAGNTAIVTAGRWPITVHPRAGGEHHPIARCLRRAIGSSPRGRGTPLASRCHMARRRFIPARAGNTTWMRRCGRSTAVHPRAGGEHATFRARAPPAPGSSPRGRGTQPLEFQELAAERFIPARAGNTNH